MAKTFGEHWASMQVQELHEMRDLLLTIIDPPLGRWELKQLVRVGRVPVMTPDEERWLLDMWETYYPGKEPPTVQAEQRAQRGLSRVTGQG